MAAETIDFEVELFEIFNSQEGEFPKVGVYSTFVRASKCQLSCPFCDTMENPANKVRTFKYSEIKALVQETNALTFTGGEPSLFIHDIIKILNQLLDDQVYLDYVKIETNGVELNKLVNMIDIHYPQLKNRFIISWSPKIYNKSLFETMLNHLYETDLTNVFIKIVGVPQDEFKIKKFLEIAKEQHGTKLMKRIALMPLSIVEKGVSLKKSDAKSLDMIFDLVRDYKVNITPRLHEILDVR
jgi:organic radical activating enzyme